jgi:hypothetical protein
MRTLNPIRLVFIFVALASAAVPAWSQTPNWQVNRQARAVVNRLVMNTTNFQRELARNRFPWETTTNAEERLTSQATALVSALESLRTSLNSNGDPMDELNGVLSRASRINMLVSRNQVNSRAQTQWTAIRTDVNTLAGYYNVSWNWNEQYPGTNNGRGTGYGTAYGNGYGNRSITGTYRLNTSMSDDVSSVVNRSVGYYSTDQRDRMRRGLERRLTPPDMLAIERNGRTITMSSSIQSQVTFDADGVPHTETNERGRTVTTTVTSDRNGFAVKTTGDRGNDFTVTFQNDGNGRLRVTRQFYVENRSETISSTSVYDRMTDRADWSAIIPQTTGPWFENTGSYGGTGEFFIPNGVMLTARLRNSVNSRVSQIGDRFTMDVVSPSEYNGAVIEGHVAQATNSGRVSGRANLQLDFDTINVSGRQYAFAGMINSVDPINGDSVTVNNEGTIRDNDQTTKTVTRAGVGALLGAVIGAVAGGGQGAAIGAAVGAGAGAGSVLIGGRDNIELANGSTFTITSSAPPRTASYRRQ